MPKAIGVRLNKQMLQKIAQLSREEDLDRSTIIRKLIRAGYKDVMKEKAAIAYRQGKLTMSEAARQAEITLWEMEQYLIEQGYTSAYSIEDWMEEVAQ